MAVSVGLASLAVMVGLFGEFPALMAKNLIIEAFPTVLAAVIAGLAASKIVVRVFGPSALAESCFLRYAVAVGAVCIGAVFIGLMLTIIFVLSGTVDTIGSLTLLQRIATVLIASFYGVYCGAMVGLIEGLILALPLAGGLMLFRSGR